MRPSWAVVFVLATGMPWLLAAEEEVRSVDLAYAAARAPDGTPAHAGERVRVVGVANSGSDAYFTDLYKVFIQDDTGALCLFNRTRLADIQAGDRIEAEGRLEGFNGTVQLVPSRLSILGHGEPPAPQRVALRELLGPRLLGRLVETTATVIGRSTRTAGALNVTLASDNAVLVAHLTGKQRTEAPAEALEVGSTVRVRGIASQFSLRPPFDSDWQIQPRGGGDFTLVRPPPLFTWRELALVAAVVAALLLAGLAAVLFLQREVRRRTRQYRETAERLRAANQQLSEAMRLKDDVVSMVSHDFRTPLTLIQGYSEMLQRRVEDPEVRGRLAVIHAHARRLAALAEATLTMSRLDSGSLAFQQQPVSLCEVVRTAMEAQEGVTRRIELQAPDGDLTVRADREWLQEAMANLLGNAVKYAEGDGVVQVTVRRVEAGGEVGVANAGPPFPPEDMERLFQKFSRLEPARQKGIPGTGLGLYICRSIVEAHGGRIWAENEPGRVVFRFALPLWNGAPAAAT